MRCYTILYCYLRSYHASILSALSYPVLTCCDPSIDSSQAMPCHAMPCHAMSVASYDITQRHVLTVIVHSMVTNHTSTLSSPYSSLFSTFSLLSTLFHSPFCLQVRALPIAVLRPTAGAAEALSYALLGKQLNRQCAE